MAEEKKYIIKVQGKKVEVSEEVYRTYVQPIRTEQRRKRREWKCNLIHKHHYYRCDKKCEECPYYLSGQNAVGNVLSLDRLADEGIDIPDESMDVEERFIEEETKKEEYQKLYNALAKLTDKEQQIIKMLFFEARSTVEVGKILGVSQQAVSKIKIRILKKIKLFF